MIYLHLVYSYIVARMHIVKRYVNRIFYCLIALTIIHYQSWSACVICGPPFYEQSPRTFLSHFKSDTKLIAAANRSAITEYSVAWNIIWKLNIVCLHGVKLKGTRCRYNEIFVVCILWLIFVMQTYIQYVPKWMYIQFYYVITF